MSTEPTTTRTIERSIRIEAPPGAVWGALTEAEGLANWFPVEARVEPGVGGRVWMRFTADVEHESPIGAWDEGRHLQLVYCEPNEQVPHRVAVDYFIEADGGDGGEGGLGGATVLRLVHSGFSGDAAWDALYDGTERGWACMLGALKHYLEHHAGVRRDPIVIKQSIGELSIDEAWGRLFGPYGLGAGATVEGLAPGDRFALRTVDADELEGTVRRLRPGDDFEATLDTHNDGLIRVQIDDIFGARDAYITIWTWGVDAREVSGLRKRLGAMMATLFGAEPGAEHQA